MFIKKCCTTLLDHSPTWPGHDWQQKLNWVSYIFNVFELVWKWKLFRKCGHAIATFYTEKKLAADQPVGLVVHDLTLDAAWKLERVWGKCMGTASQHHTVARRAYIVCAVDDALVHLTHQSYQLIHGIVDGLLFANCNFFVQCSIMDGMELSQICCRRSWYRSGPVRSMLGISGLKMAIFGSVRVGENFLKIFCNQDEKSVRDRGVSNRV